MGDPAGDYHRDASTVYLMAAATRLSRRWGLSVGVLATLIAAQTASPLALLIGVLAGFATFRIARFAWCRRLGIPDVPLIADLLPAPGHASPA